MTRARAALGEALMIGVVALFCAASMLGSQFRGPRWRHLFGIDVNPKFGPSFSLNNDGAPLLAMDILTLSVDDFDKLLASYAPGDMKYLLLVVTLDCGRASKANRTATNEEKRKFYMAAVAKVEELTKAAERKYNVFLFWEFVNCGFVLDLVEETFPEIDMITLEGHLFEDRERVFMSQRLDKGMELFEEELDSLVEAAGGESCAAAGLEGAGMEVPPGSKLFGSWTKKAYRQTHKGRDPWSRCAPTITKQGLWLVLPSGREIKITVEVLHYLRTAGGDWEFLFAPEDKPTLRRLILAMGVSTVVGSAARRSVERSVDGAAGGEIPKELLYYELVGGRMGYKTNGHSLDRAIRWVRRRRCVALRGGATRSSLQCAARRSQTMRPAPRAQRASRRVRSRRRRSASGRAVAGRFRECLGRLPVLRAARRHAGADGFLQARGHAGAARGLRRGVADAPRRASGDVLHLAGRLPQEEVREPLAHRPHRGGPPPAPLWLHSRGAHLLGCVTLRGTSSTPCQHVVVETLR